MGTGRLGQIGLVTSGRSFWARSIRLSLGVATHHVIIDVGRGQVISSQLGGAALLPASRYEDALWSRFDFHQWQAEGVADFARAREGTPYNVAGTIAILATHYLTLKVPQARAFAFYQCAQLAEDALMHGAGVLVFPAGRTSGPATPGDFERLFIARGWYLPEAFRSDLGVSKSSQ